MPAIFLTKKAKAEMRARRRKKRKQQQQRAAVSTKAMTEDSNNDNKAEKMSVPNVIISEHHTALPSSSFSNNTKRKTNKEGGNDYPNETQSRPQDSCKVEEENVSSGNATNGMSPTQEQTPITRVIQIPRGLTGKQARKFRKDARRKAKMEGRHDVSTQIRFVTDEDEQQNTSDNIDNHNSNNNKEKEPSKKDKRGKRKLAGSDEASTRPCKEKDGADIHHHHHHHHEEEEDNDEPPTKKSKINKRSNNITKPTFPRINDILAAHEAAQKRKAERKARLEAEAKIPQEIKAKYIALDCEMVGIGTGGKQSALARTSLVDWDGKVLLDTFVRVPNRVTDFRTFVSGVRARDIHIDNEKAMDPVECRERVCELLNDKILIGHSLRNDLAALLITHPGEDMRDTARYRPFMRAAGGGGGKFRPRKLRDLAKEYLGLDIQVEGTEHCSVDDARAAMELYKFARDKWEKDLLMKKKSRRGGKKGKG